MSKRFWLSIALVASVTVGVAYAQYPMMDVVVQNVIQKYQSSTCEQLWQERAKGQGQSKPEMEQRAIQALRNDAQMRQAFINQVAGPVVNKMFECGMVP